MHGGWHGAWCWDKVASALRAQGHRVTAVDLPGRGVAPELAGATTPADFMESVGQVVRRSPMPVVLVGHSLGGATISLVAKAFPDRIAHLVYVTAFMVPPRQTVGSIAMADKGTLIPVWVRRDTATRTSTVIPEKPRHCSMRTAPTPMFAPPSSGCARSRRPCRPRAAAPASAPG
ncbi:alpha/beta fold hydrolase [uncultured Pseudacidovorax sp.]|uniref:alpha/beta fold hydrolase n=1 Tax=uncultured Pseudacidovorax sp. TaxID=679313 RepID=UPI00344EAC92